MHTVYFDFKIWVSPEEVFKAVTEPVQLENWWTKTCSGKPAKGEEYNFFFEDPYDWYGEISVLDPFKTVHYLVTKADVDWEGTLFGFNLKAIENGTRVSFFHRNWRAVNDNYKESGFIWAMSLNRLKNYLEKGEIIPFEERC